MIGPLTFCVTFLGITGFVFRKRMKYLPIQQAEKIHEATKLAITAYLIGIIFYFLLVVQDRKDND